MKRLIFSRSRNQVIASLKPAHLSQVKEFGRYFRGIELDLSDRLDATVAKRALETCGKEGIAVKAIHMPNPRRLACMIGSRRIPDFLVGAESRVFVFHAWIVTDQKERDDIERLSKFLARSGNAVVIENVSNPRRMFSSPSQVASFFQRRQLFGFCLDTCHPIPRRGQDTTATVIQYLEAAGDGLKHVHLSDADLNEGRRHLPIGKGKIDWDRFFAKIQDIGYAGLFTLELEGVELGDFASSLEFLRRYGLSADDGQAYSLLTAVQPTRVAADISFLLRVPVTEADLIKLLGESRVLYEYSDERNALFFFNSCDGRFAPFLQQSDFPRVLPEISGVVGLLMDTYRIHAVYFDREAGVAVRTTLVDLRKDEKRSFEQFLLDIQSAISSRRCSSDVVRMLNGSVL